MEKPFKFGVGDLVTLTDAAKKLNLALIRESTYGTVADVFEVVACFPALRLASGETEISYSITPVGKRYSSVALPEHELKLRKRAKGAPLSDPSPIAEPAEAVAETAADDIVLADIVFDDISLDA